MGHGGRARIGSGGCALRRAYGLLPRSGIQAVGGGSRRACRLLMLALHTALGLPCSLARVQCPACNMSEIRKGWDDILAVSDLFDGLSLGRIQGNWGHSERYWRDLGNRQVEVSAELFALQSSGEMALWNEVVGYIPRLCQAVERILARR